MLFHTTRTSLSHCPNEKPHESAMVKEATYKAGEARRWAIWVVEIASIDGLVEFQKAVKHPIVIQESPYIEYPFTIEIEDEK